MDPTSAPAAAAHDFSFIGLFLQADPIVKSVMILLVVASIACWTVVFEKLVRFAAAKRQAKAFDTLVRSDLATVSKSQSQFERELSAQLASGPGDARLALYARNRLLAGPARRLSFTICGHTNVNVRLVTARGGAFAVSIR